MRHNRDILSKLFPNLCLKMTIDTCYEGIMATLTRQNKIINISQKLLSMQRNYERVLFVYDVIKELNAFPPVLEVPKSADVSIHYRNQGNQCFKSGQDYKAWQLYNLALLYAPIGSEYYALSLANRSAVFFSLNKNTECLKDIEEVLSLNYPENLKKKLLIRQKLAKEQLDKSKGSDNVESKKSIDDIIVLKDKRNSRCPCASDTIEVVYSKHMGRHVIAKEDIDVGEVLAQEDPYFTLLMKSQFLFCCNYCLSRNLNLIPCDYCCYVLYCNKTCKENAWNDYHSTECALMPSLIDLEFTKLELLGLRTIIKAFNDHKSWSKLFETIEDAEKNLDSEFRGHVQVDGNWVYDSKYYASIHTLESNVDKRSVSDIFLKAVTAAVFLNFLEVKTNFLDSGNEDDVKVRKCVAGSLLHHIMTSPTNMHQISSNIGSAEGNYVEVQSIASAAYAFHSLLNHSCAPNVVRFGKLGTAQMSLMALRPIKKGMQLFDNYGSHHALEPRIMRQHSLRIQYYFTCLCEACENDWPIYFHLTPAKSVIPPNIYKKKEKLLNPRVIEKLQKGDRGTALKTLKPLCILMGILESYAPCTELADCQESMKQCVAIIEGCIPFGYSQLIEWNAVPQIK